MSSANQPLDAFRRRVLAGEKGRVFIPSKNRFLLGYPGTYKEAMSSLGYLSILRIIDEIPGWCAERAVLESGEEPPLRSLESDRPVSDYPVIGLSVGYELQLIQVVHFLRSSGLEPCAETRAQDRKHGQGNGNRRVKKGRGRVGDMPLIVGGGPLTRINPRPLGAFVDICVLGDGETAVPDLLKLIEENSDAGFEEILEEVSNWRGFYVPVKHGDMLPDSLTAPANTLPARASIRTREAEFGEMFLIEACRGCSMNCHFCSMRRKLSGGARYVSASTVLSSIPENTKRVGLVGASVGQHPELGFLLNALADRGMGAGLSSVRADRVNDEIVSGLSRLGMKTLTIAADGTSQSIRDRLQKGVNEEDLRSAAALAAKHGLQKLKIYQLIGVPGETDEDWKEMEALALDLSRELSVELSFSCLVPKPGTPLTEETPMRPKFVRRRVRELKRRLMGKVQIKEPGLRWVEVEWRLSHGTLQTGRALLKAIEEGGGGVSSLRRVL